MENRFRIPYTDESLWWSPGGPADPPPLRRLHEVNENNIEPSGVPPEDPYEVFDRNTLEMLIEISQGDRSFLEKLFDSFEAHGDPAIPEFSRLLEAGESSTLADLAHKVRGAAIQLGAIAFAQLCHDLEIRAKSRELEGCAGMVERLGAEYDRVKRAIRIVRSRPIEGD